MNWPLGNGDDFKGVYDRRTHTVHCFERAAHGATRAAVSVTDVGDPQLAAMVSEPVYTQFREGIELLDGAGGRFDRAAMLRGQDDAGLLRKRRDELRRAALPRRVRRDGAVAVAASRRRSGRRMTFTGFVFKIQANMDPRHRDRVAFVRVCSGEFARDMTVRNARTGADATSLARNAALRRRSRVAGDGVCRRRRRACQSGRVCDRRHALRRRAGAISANPCVCPGTFCVGAQYRRFGLQVVRKRHRAAARGGRRASLLSVGIRREPSRFSVRSASCSSRSRSTGSNRSTTSRHGSTTLPYSLALHVEGDREQIARAQLPSNAKLVEDWNGRPVVLFESEWSVRLAREWNPTAAVCARSRRSSARRRWHR